MCLILLVGQKGRQDAPPRRKRRRSHSSSSVMPPDSYWRRPGSRDASPASEATPLPYYEPDKPRHVFIPHTPTVIVPHETIDARNPHAIACHDMPVTFAPVSADEHRDCNLTAPMPAAPASQAGQPPAVPPKPAKPKEYGDKTTFVKRVK